jgi:acetyl-CoA acyltransferase
MSNVDISSKSAYVYDAVRTPFGRHDGLLSAVRPDDLAACVITAIVERAPALDSAMIDDVVWGNANGAGEENRNVGRMAGLLAGLPVTVPGTTVNRLCGSSLDAAIMASRGVESGDLDLVLTGGVESMTRAPWVLPKPSRAFPVTDTEAVSTSLGWRLVNPQMPGEWTISLGECNEQLGEKYQVSRQSQDEFAMCSHQRAHHAWESGFYKDLVTPVAGVGVTPDESIRPSTSLDQLAKLKPSFRADGTITAGNASPLSDGAAAVLLGSEAAAETVGRAPIARIAAKTAVALDPRDFGYAPVVAANRALAAAGIGWHHVGAVELNEAFAVQSVACIQAWPVDPAIVNQWGGALAIGHPLGASGARILGTLAAVLRHTKERWGVACICIGVGQGLAIVLENTEISA